MIRIVFRHLVPDGAETAFVLAWERCKKKMLARAPGALESSLFKDAQDPGAFVSVTRWRSVEDWNAYWGEGIPDPEGELARNQVLEEVRTVAREGPRPSPAAE